MLRGVVEYLRFLFGIGLPADSDGFGQSLCDDMRFARHFRRCRTIAVTWRSPSADEATAIEVDPVMGRFGDDTIGVASVGDEVWVVRDRMWFGWPDPPEFVFFALQGTTIRAAKDFDHWPTAWTPPEPLSRS
ncbi:hypothetical protein [Sphingomonas sp. Leaf25]|uniref:hypothetical protein n=1 Tax=Sphingomonas sp. Leaf25 TaxID=1735692 RepID=UPI0006FBA9FD|nr:hypothetical protein [Sphingomonas sp. Leaf25]KQM98299.1 hypothetical protein ASE78_08650 [Sphingomonas sp. Leaf25]